MNSPNTPSPQLLTLPYQPDSAGYFHTIACQLPMAVMLQSDCDAAHNTAPRGRFDILTAAPEYWLQTRRGQASWHGLQPPSLPLVNDSFANLHNLLDHIENAAIDYRECIKQALPFCGGLIGYCSYDLAREYLQTRRHETDDINIPGMQFGFYGWACIQDHQQKQSWLVIHPHCNSELQQRLPALLQTASLQYEIIPPSAKSVSLSQAFSCDMTASQYKEKFSAIQDLIQAGDCYQINFSRRFQARINNSPIDIYLQLRKRMPSPFCTLLPILGEADTTILSFSPERFLQMDTQHRVVTQPIKGTAARHSDPAEDRKNAELLSSDPKNRAENLMIVDLLRNDLGKVCETGSVKTEKLFELQSFANVHHLVSSISGQLKPELNGADLLQACFPGGSITGAPKLRAMQIIDALETAQRSIYCGTIACFSAHGAMDSNITIRTLLLQGEKIYCWGGGGIVADSDCDSELEESSTKIQALLDACN